MTTPADEFYYLATSLAADNDTLVTNHPCILRGVQCENKRTSTVFLCLFDKASAAPVSGTDTPIKKIPIPALSVAALDFPSGIKFTLGMGFALVTGTAITDSGAVAAGDIVALNLDFTR